MSTPWGEASLTLALPSLRTGASEKPAIRRDNQERPLGWIKKAGSAGLWPKLAPLEELKMDSNSKLKKGQEGQLPEISQPAGASSLCPSMPGSQTPPALSLLPKPGFKTNCCRELSYTKSHCSCER